MRKLKAKIYEFDVPNSNGYIYPKIELIRAVEEYNNDNQYVVLGGYPPWETSTDLSKIVGISHLVIEDNFVTVFINLLSKDPSFDEWYVMPTAIGNISDDKKITDLQISSMHILPTIEVCNISEGMFKLTK